MTEYIFRAILARMFLVLVLPLDSTGGMPPERCAGIIYSAERYGAPFGSFVFGMLQHADLPDVAASLAPRRVCLAGAVDAAGGTLEVAAVRAVYGGEHIVVRGEAKWDAEALG